jgi:predicted Zn-dependent protease
MKLKKIIVLLFMVVLLFSNSISAQACIEDVNIPQKGPITMMCDMTIEATNCTHSDIDGDYSAGISSIHVINDEAYLRFKGLEQYSSILNQAIDTWNVYDLVHLEMNEVDYTVEFLRENLGDNQVLARYIYTGEINYIVINTYYFNDLAENEQVHILIHELGHALGLDDNLYHGSIMNQGLSEGKKIVGFDLINLEKVLLDIISER